ncbi:FKBP-type peptidyl-prolyl cis-trans isomerase [Erythrobacter sp.]|uniref:FKBP-type peptidyl-prolyl cis-trans isomerase n=1 Tax=Erythrobacter sp. TaxID=1042 RepID=UPI002EC7DD37|nr:FKBP-type peptidyl-prolyl cis-trans isomerase [Erythrobacter sp.]
MRGAALFAALALLTPGAALAEAHDEADPVAEAEAQRAFLNAQQAYLSGLMAKDGWYTGEGGLKYRYVDYRGTGPSPEVSDTVTVHYAGTFIDGETFDSSFDRGQPATFPLGGLIPAWQIAIPIMHMGETIEIAAPSTIAYGPRGKGPIPGGATLLFRIELLGIEGR